MRYDQNPFILAVSPSARSFAFVLFRGREHPFDWGVKRVDGGGKNFRIINVIAKLIRAYHPTTIVIEDTRRRTRRRVRNQELLHTIAKLAAKKNIKVVRYTRPQVRATFAKDGARTKPEIAKSIAARIPALAPHLPPLRKIWQSEDPRQSLFDAAALGLTHYTRVI